MMRAIWSMGTASFMLACAPTPEQARQRLRSALVGIVIVEEFKVIKMGPSEVGVMGRFVYPVRFIAQTKVDPRIHSAEPKVPSKPSREDIERYQRQRADLQVKGELLLRLASSEDIVERGLREGGELELSGTIYFAKHGRFSEWQATSIER